MIEPYYTREQAEALHKLRDAAGGKAFDVAWAKLIAEVPCRNGMRRRPR